MKELKQKDSKGAGYVLLYMVSVDDSTRTFFAKTIEEIQKEIDKYKQLEYIGLVSVFQVENYWDL